MKLISARQAWSDAQHESNTSISAVAAEGAQTQKQVLRTRAARREVIFAAQGDDKEVRIKVVRERISISETRRTPIGRSTARAAHLMTMGKVQAAIDTLPFQVQQFGHYLYHPCMTAIHMLNAEKLIWGDLDFSAMTEQKSAKAHCMVTIALQSYKTEVHGGPEWGPARIADGMLKIYGVIIEPKHWDRDWLDAWNLIRVAIEDVDIQAQQPVWQVIHAEKDEEAA